MPRHWDPSLTTGLESVDEQHRRLIDLLEGLVAAMEAGRARAEIGRLLDDLGAYTELHFSHEEECMTRYACPVAEQNVTAHRAFLRILADFRAEFEEAGATPRLVLRVEDQLAWWLDNHIRRVDTALYPCVRAAAGG